MLLQHCRRDRDMYAGRLVYSQLIDHLPMHSFRRCVQRYSGNHRVKSFNGHAPYLIGRLAITRNVRACYPHFSSSDQATIYWFKLRKCGVLAPLYIPTPIAAHLLNHIDIDLADPNEAKYLEVCHVCTRIHPGINIRCNNRLCTSLCHRSLTCGILEPRGPAITERT